MKINKLTLTAVLVAAGIIAAPSAMAASASASIGPIEILTVAMKPGASITWTGDSTWSGSEAYTANPDQSDSLYDDGYDWNALLSTLANTSGASASSSITSSTGTTLLSAAQALLTNTSYSYWSFNYGQSSANASRSFTTTGPMAIFISAPYSIFADPGTGTTGGSAYASVMLDLSYTASSGTFNSYSYSGTDDSVQACNDNNYWLCSINTGVLSASGDIDSGIVTGKTTGYGSFSVYTSAEAHQQPQLVPVPAAAWLLGSGLIGLVAVGRRKEPA